MTSTYTDDLSPTVAAELARLMLDRHEGGGTCPACRSWGCPEQVGAARVIAADRRRRAEARGRPSPW